MEKDKLISEYQNQIAELKLDLGSTEDELEKTTGELSVKRKDLMLAEDAIKDHLETIEKKNKRIEELYEEVQATTVRATTLKEEL